MKTRNKFCNYSIKTHFSVLVLSPPTLQYHSSFLFDPAPLSTFVYCSILIYIHIYESIKKKGFSQISCKICSFSSSTFFLSFSFYVDFFHFLLVDVRWLLYKTVSDTLNFYKSEEIAKRRRSVRRGVRG